MKQSLQLRLGQHLTMTPQLQQAIRLLQLSTLELRTEVQQALESNPMLELEDEGGAEEFEAPSFEEPAERTPAEDDFGAADERGEGEADLDMAEAPIPEDLPVDSAWDDVFDNIGTGTGPAGEQGERDFEAGDSAPESLKSHLHWQLTLTPLSDKDRLIGEVIIDAVSEDGFLTQSLQEIHEGLPAELEVDLDEVTAVLHVIQNFDPPGVAARDLRESLAIQLRQLPAATPWLAEAQRAVAEHFELLAGRDYAQLKRRLKLDDGPLSQVLRLIQSLNPRPGGQISDAKPEYIVPDVIVRKQNGRWRVELNPEAAPRLRINAQYADLAKQVQNASDSTYMKNQLQEARWFIKSLLSRNETLLKVASTIVERQRDFLEHGEVAMRALVLHDIAEAVGMHESTISRVTTRKYMHTPRGIFELKYFFSSHVSTASGGECSSTAIRALIKKLLAEENPAKPLSDSKIAEILSEQGINVARRTVAKYREAMAIPPSNERKRLA
ncbi:MAG: RNA polymerase factor sigma-54 [Thiohalomonadaceae bacterium]